ncbi:hypothetical protein Trydic_g16991 [Trypoxylus dichotomus]
MTNFIALGATPREHRINISPTFDPDSASSCDVGRTCTQEEDEEEEEEEEECQRTEQEEEAAKGYRGVD